jgi:hypothetical protein
MEKNVKCVPSNTPSLFLRITYYFPGTPPCVRAFALCTRFSITFVFVLNQIYQTLIEIIENITTSMMPDLYHQIHYAV